MGTTSTTGWAVFWFLIGFTILGTSAVGGGWLSLVGALAVLGLSVSLFQTARVKEDA